MLLFQLVTVIFSFLCMQCRKVDCLDVDDKDRYAVVIDGGSTGSRR